MRGAVHGLSRTYVILVAMAARWTGRMLGLGVGGPGVTGYLRVRGMGAPSSSKARRWTGVGSVSLLICWPLKVMVWRSRVDRWLSRSPYLRTGSLPALRLAAS